MKKKVKLITEQSFDVELVESRDSKNMYVAGVFSTAIAENANSRKYPKEILEREVDKFIEKKINGKCSWGELGHPSSPEINLDRTAIFIESLEWKSNNVFGKAKVLSTPNGEILKTLIKEGGKVGISSRGLGTVNDEGWVNEDFSLVTYDIVGSPSNNGSWLNGIYEDQDFFINLEESEEEVKEKLEQARESYKKYIWQVLEKI
ncbi:MAG: primosomal protein [Atribacterota bacterium]